MTVSALLTDSYQLAMVQSYLDNGMGALASFEFYSRRLPKDRAFLLAAGLDQVLEYLENLRFTKEEIAFLRSTGRYREGLLSYLEHFRFTGRVLALPEGTPFFANEPMLRIEAPLPQAQLVETRIINLLHLETLIASKAARSVLAAKGKTLVEFGLRRAHGAEAGLLGARASFLAGFDGSSNVLAELRFGVPVFGTMAHSLIEAQEDENTAFERFARSNPASATLLIDTYDTEKAGQALGTLAAKLNKQGIRIRGVRLDSGDLAQHARNVRKILDQNGLREVTIFASGGIDEYEVEALVAGGAPIDGFGIGTHLSTSSDAPYLDSAYKLVEYAGIPRLKLSEGKATFAGPKQIFRQFDGRGLAKLDIVALDGEHHPGEPLLRLYMQNGTRLNPPASLTVLRKNSLQNLTSLPAEIKTLNANHAAFPVLISDKLRALTESVARQFRK